MGFVSDFLVLKLLRKKKQTKKKCFNNQIRLEVNYLFFLFRSRNISMTAVVMAADSNFDPGELYLWLTSANVPMY